MDIPHKLYDVLTPGIYNFSSKSALQQRPETRDVFLHIPALICPSSLKYIRTPGLNRIVLERLSRLGVSRLAVSKLAVSRLSVSRLGVSKLGVSRLNVSRLSVNRLFVSRLGVSKLCVSRLGVSKLCVSRLGVSKLDCIDSLQRHPPLRQRSCFSKVVLVLICREYVCNTLNPLSGGLA